MADDPNTYAALWTPLVKTLTVLVAGLLGLFAWALARIVMLIRSDAQTAAKVDAAGQRQIEIIAAVQENTAAVHEIALGLQVIKSEMEIRKCRTCDRTTD